MIGKLCRAPKGGASAGKVVEYLVGYAVAEKGASKEDIREALDGVFAEAENRPDLGAGQIFSPSAGHGTRPSSILARNVDSLATASLEMDSDAVGNAGVRSSAMHFVWSFSEAETKHLTDEQVHQYVGEVLEKLGLAHHRSVAVVHRDTENIHVHVAVGSVDPETGLAYDRTGLYKKMAWAEREVELAHGLEHDRGLAVVRDAGTVRARIEWADTHELAAWRAERREERLLRMERRSWEGYRERDVTFARYADATVAQRLQAAVDTASERGRKIDWADLHAVAARYGVQLERDAAGEIILRDVGIAETRYLHGREIVEIRSELRASKTDPDEIDRLVADRKAEHSKAEVIERDRKTAEGETVPLASVLPGVESLPEFRSVEESEHDIAERVREKPQIVLNDVTAQSSTFTREDVDLWLCSRISDPEEIERLGDLVMRDESIRMLSADTMQPLHTTTEILAVEDRLADDARTLAHTDSGITHKQIDRAIATYEAEQSKKIGKAFNLNAEQRTTLHGIVDGSLISIEGFPGVGKTTVMGAVRVLGEQTGHAVVGITLSQAAAERLESEAGFRCVNSSRAALLEEKEEGSVIPWRGIVVVDEAAMMDSRANGRVLALARERGCIVQEIYDTRQLQPIDFGGSARIIRDAATEVGTHFELRDIQRQKNDWHKEAVAIMADAIVERDEAKRLALVTKSLEILDRNGAIKWVKDRNEALDVAVQVHRVDKALGHHDALLIAADKDSVRHLCEEARRRDGLEGRGLTFVTRSGKREIAVGDSLIFLENSLGKRGLGVLNGDRGVVESVARDQIGIRLHDGRTVAFSPRSYKSWDHASALSVHKSQGASVSGCTSVIDPSASAELLFVAMSRSQRALSVVVAESNFKDVNELAEHISNRISLKTTSRNYDEIVAKTGGRETMRVQNMEAQREAATSPLRRIYDHDVREPALADRAERIADLRKTYAIQKKIIESEAGLSLTQRLEKQREALSSFRSAAGEIYKATQPRPYLDWLHEHEGKHERAHEISQTREAKRAKEQQRDVKSTQRSAEDRHRPTREHTKEIFPDHGYER